MLEEQNDNLHKADGNLIEETNNTIQEQETNAETQAIVEDILENNEVSNETIIEEISTTEVTMPNSVMDNDIEISENQNIVELTDDQVAEEISIEETKKSALETIEESNAEESEDETLKNRHEIPLLDYDTMSLQQLVEELENLVTVEKVMSVKDHVEALKKAFLTEYQHFIEEKKEEFLAENPETTEDFHYHLPLKTTFEHLYSQYRDKKNNHFQSLQNNLKANLNNRLTIVEELKELINSTEPMSSLLKQFNDIRDRWKVAGPIPKDKYNHVWNNYHFHLENFYDILHLDREIRDLDFKHNLEQKQKIIARVEELVHEEDIHKAFRELQDLHRIWKEEIGPVSRDIREDVWNKFSDLTKQMHDKRENFYASFREVEIANLVSKKEIIAKLEELANEKVDSHNGWQEQIQKVEALRNEFFAVGKVPSEVNEATWYQFKTEVRNFNKLKNLYYKDLKQDQHDNLSKKQALVEKVKALKESTDFAATTPLMKQIQEEWKTVGHVPRKLSDKLWKEFRAACNEYFENLKSQRKELDSDEVAAFEKKKEYLETIKSFELIGEHKTDLDGIKAHIETWKSFGKVPFSRRYVEGKFNKILDVLFEKLSSSKKENDLARYSNKLDHLASLDSRKIDGEKIFIMRKIDEVQNDLFQLENNIQFFANADANNPLVKEVHKNIEKQKEELATWKDKLKQLNNFMA
ncbi:DUF349 domain-containing protein [Flavobacterium sp.]